MTAEKRDVRILLDTDAKDYGDSRRTLHFRAYPVYVLADGSVRNFAGSLDKDPLADLQITAQHDRVAANPYGWRVEYRDVFSVDLNRAETMVKTLRRIERRMDAMRDELGYPESFAAYVTRVGKILGVKSYGQYRREIFPNGSHYRWNGADYVSDYVRHACEEFAKVAA